MGRMTGYVYTRDTYCSDCGVKTKDGEAIPANGHQCGKKNHYKLIL